MNFFTKPRITATRLCVGLVLPALVVGGNTAFASCDPGAVVAEVGGDIPLRLPFQAGEHYLVTQSYCDGDHTGYQVDFAMPTGTPVVATSDGTVVQLGNYSNNCNNVSTQCGLDFLQQGGLFIKVQHPCSESGKAWYSSYLHLSYQSVTNGQHVESGQIIGFSGNTGLSTGPHLHFHIRKGPSDNPLNVPANHVGVRPTPMRGLEVATGTNPLQSFTVGRSYQALDTPASSESITNIMSPIASYQFAQDYGSEVYIGGGVMSPFASYQFPNNLISEVLSNGSIISPFASYQYCEWPDGSILQLQTSQQASYYWQFSDAPLFNILPTSRVPKTAESTVATLFSVPSQLEFYSAGSFNTNPPFPLDQNKMTVVMTHGWNSDPDEWATNMAALMVARLGATSPNIVAWDWRANAKTALPGTAGDQTLSEGTLLGQALASVLGVNYSKPIHFVGHSLGTMVNASAADYLHTNGFAWTNTQVTLFDEAEAAKSANSFGSAITTLIGLNGNPLSPKPSYYHPLPKQFRWADNYVAAFGLLHPEAVNVILTNHFPANAANLSGWFDAMTAFHGYPMKWYDGTIPADVSTMGFLWSFERGSNLALAPAANSVLLQVGTEWNLVITNWNYGTNFLNTRFQTYQLLLAKSLPAVETISAAVNGVGNGEIILGALPAFNSFIFSLQTTPKNTPLTPQVQMRPRGLSGGDATGGNTNIPAYAWISIVIPPNAVAMSFDYKIQGDWQSDSLAAAFNGTNFLCVSGGQIESNTVYSSEMIDVSAFAGQTNELFIGIVGGTSTNAQMTVQNLVFSISSPPLLQAQATGDACVLSWPLSAADYALQTSTNLADANSWTAITNVPAILDLQNTVTNPISARARFYRLKK